MYQETRSSSSPSVQAVQKECKALTLCFRAALSHVLMQKHGLNGDLLSLVYWFLWKCNSVWTGPRVLAYETEETQSSCLVRVQEERLDLQRKSFSTEMPAPFLSV